MRKVWHSLQAQYHRLINSFALLPALIALLFLFLSMGMLWIDFSEGGKFLKASLKWISLKDPATARSIITAITTGILSLAVFSFSMVMIILNQAASNMSNRVLEHLITNRFQQIVLGSYIGTIVYALIVLSTIRNLDSSVEIPALSTYLLILITIIDISLFISFLHYITQSVKYKTIISRIRRKASRQLEAHCTLRTLPLPSPPIEGIQLLAKESGILQNIERKALLELCSAHNLLICFHYPFGSFLLKGTAFATVKGAASSETIEKINELVHIGEGSSPEAAGTDGMRHLTEIAVRALSPGINDPVTAIESMRALIELLLFQTDHFAEVQIEDDQHQPRLLLRQFSFEELFNAFALPPWDYGKKDRMFRNAVRGLLEQLRTRIPVPYIETLINEAIALEKESSLKGSLPPSF